MFCGRQQPPVDAVSGTDVLLVLLRVLYLGVWPHPENGHHTASPKETTQRNGAGGPIHVSVLGPEWAASPRSEPGSDRNEALLP